MVTLTSAGPLVVIGIYQAILGGSGSNSGSLSNSVSLFLAIATLSTFAISLLFALYGLVRVAVLNIGGGPIYLSNFLWLTVVAGISIAVFLVSILMASALLLFSV